MMKLSVKKKTNEKRSLNPDMHGLSTPLMAHKITYGG